MYSLPNFKCNAIKVLIDFAVMFEKLIEFDEQGKIIG